MRFPWGPRQGSRRFAYALAFVGGGAFLLVLQGATAFFRSCDGHGLLNPRMPCNGTIRQGEWDYEPLRDQLTQWKAEAKEAGYVSHLSIYFRDLAHGPRFGIGEYDEFQPASLTKVPIMIALLHYADLDPSFLDKTLSFSGSLRVERNVESSEQTIQPNTPYTVRELIRRMIVFSDNHSYALLVRELNATPPVVAYYTFRDLDILRMMLSPNADYVSIHSYASLFGVLYNAGYLSREYSQLALRLLSETTFRDGLVAGVPAHVRVAHKFGIRDLEGDEIQLHDCGIVYHPAGAYVLCVMTSGTDLAKEKAVIADVSRMVYDGVSALTRGNP